MLSAGFNEPEVERALDESWVWREAYVAETDDQALEEFLPAHQSAYEHLDSIREEWNPIDQPVRKQAPPLPRSAYEGTPVPSGNELLIGSPKRVSEQLALLRDAGARNLMLTHRGLVSADHAARSHRLLAEKSMPLFR